MDDPQLLRLYAHEASHDAFATLVNRYTNLVYSSALRQIRDAHKAQDITQAVFLVLARKAHRIRPEQVLSGWLLNAVRFAVSDALRIEARRKHRERKVAQMNSIVQPSSSDASDHDDEWAKLAPLVDGALASLNRTYRDAILLRFLEGRKFEDVAARLGISQVAARQRVARALDRLRALLVSRGVTLSAVALAALLGSHVVGPAPAGLAAASTAIVPSAFTLAVSKGVIIAMTISKAKSIAVGLLAILLLGGSASYLIVKQIAGNRTEAGAPAAPARQSSPIINPSTTPTATAAFTGTVRAPDGKPLAGAQVLLARAGQPVTLYGDRRPPGGIFFINGNQDASTAYYVFPFNRFPVNRARAVTDAAGHFTIPDAAPSAKIIVRAETGFAIAQLTASSPEITVTPWGRIEGTLQTAGKPLANQIVVLTNEPNDSDPDFSILINQSEARTDVAGHFVFEKVAPGPIWLRRTGNPPYPEWTHTALVNVKPGETARIQLGGTGREVAGHLVAPPNAREPAPWARDNAHNYVAFIRHQPDNAMPRPANWQTMTAAQQQRSIKEWEQTDQGREYRRVPVLTYFSPRPDGTFHLDDLLPGQYIIEAQGSEIVQGSGWAEPLSDVKHTFTVPDSTTGNDQPLDLGSITVRLEDRLLVGDPFPVLRGKTLDGAQFDASTLEGKYVLVLVWASFMGDETVFFANLRAAWETYGADPRFAMIGVCMDAEQPQAARAYAAKNHLDWPQVYLGQSTTKIVGLDTRVPRIYLLDPKGKVIARSLAGPRIDDALEKALGPQHP